MQLPRHNPIILPLSRVAERRRLATLKDDIAVIRICAVTLAAMATLTIGVAAGAFLAPTAIAIVLALILAPVANALERLHVPTGLAAVLSVVATVGILIAIAVSFAPSASALIKQAPEIVRSVEHKFRPLTRQLAEASKQIEHAASPASPGSTAISTPIAARVAAGGEDLLTTVAATAPDILAKMIYVSILTIFLIAYRRQYSDQLILLPPRYYQRLRMARIARDVRQRVSGYLFVLALINVGLTVVTTLCFMVAGIKDPILWGIAFGLFNFVPVIGPTSVIIAAALFGIATAPTLAQAVAPPAILLVINTIEANVVQPLLLAQRLVVSPIAIFITVATLVWMWGPPAAIVAVPTLILLHTIMLHVPAMKPFAMLLATVEGGHRRKTR